MTVLYTPGQLREAAALAPETYRHWKKALPPLRRGKGHSPSFSPGDLVAISIVRLLAVDLSVRVSALSPIAEALFELCSASPWPVLERSRISVDLLNARVELLAEVGAQTNDAPLVIIPLRAVIGKLREQLLAATSPSDQSSLRFPPTPIAASANGGRK